MCKGIVKGNTVILEEGASLPDGAIVWVHLLPNATLIPATDEQREAALRRMLSMNLPVADWPQMEEEIIRGSEA